MFSAAEASAFLAGRTGLDDEAGAAEVAAALGHLPLALALAAPLIAGQHAGYARYLDRLQATPADVSLTGDDGQPYPPGSRGRCCCPCRPSGRPTGPACAPG